DDLGIGQGRDVTGVLVVRDRPEHAAHDLARAGLGHVGHDHDPARPGDRTNLAHHRLLNALGDILARREAGFERDVEVGDTPLDLVPRRPHSSLCDLRHQQAGGFDLLGAEPVSGYVDHVVDAAQDTIVPVRRLHRPITGHIGPVAPVATLPVLAVAHIVLVDEALRVFPDRLESARPRVLDADVAGAARARRDFIAEGVVDDRVYPGPPGPRPPRLQGVKCGEGAAQEATFPRLPPGVDDPRLTLADDVEVPPPYGRLNRLTHGRHVLEVVIV